MYEVEESQLQRWTDARTKTLRERTTKDLDKKELRLQEDAAPQCTDFEYIQMWERRCYIPTRTTSGLHVASVFSTSVGPWKAVVA